MAICEHRRIIDRSHDQPGKPACDWRHYLAVVQRKPGALRNGAPFVELPEAFRTLQQHLLKKPGGDREMVDTLALFLQHDEDAVLLATEMAPETGVPRPTSSTCCIAWSPAAVRGSTRPTPGQSAA